MPFEWSKPVDNRFGLFVRTSKCGRAKIVKLNGSEQTYNEYIPFLDGEVLPRYYTLKVAKEALELAQTGQPLPKAKKPKFAIEYDRAEEATSDAGAAYQRTKDWFNARRAGSTPVTFDESPYKVLGVPTDADFSTIKSAYRKLKFTHHPDQGGDADKCREIDDAFRKLKKLHEATINVG